MINFPKFCEICFKPRFSKVYEIDKTVGKQSL